ncbi:hypothetical protein FAZ95_17315 [Trinickia violacea]|uniref:Glycosyltransferase RgtA/B/C/D-like domain-containing protein n=1 Tax=Trinickia violacea TaxID=2571746 RepID=A0A4P8IXY7_9BURK|nr:hypothetical protein [Trinickia violacea]QCP50759.1 hypothetical protein FAZ95_17315 [Trinickia violacea]
MILILAAASYWRFIPWEPTVFYGDDLYNILATLKDHEFISEWHQAFTAQFYEKYRPVFELTWLALAKVFQFDLRGFLAFNFCLHVLNATIFFAISMLLSKGNRLASLALALAFACSRFALYQVTVATGPVEGLALTMFLLVVAFAVMACRQPGEKRWQWLAVIAFALCVLTHERYLSITPLLALTLALSRSRQNSGAFDRYGAAGACFAIALLNVLIKTVLLHSAFFVGTGATHLDLNVPRIIDQSEQALLSVFGFNYGPDYLAGHSIVFDSPLPGDDLARALASITVFCALVATIYGFTAGKQSPNGQRWYPAFALMLIILLLVPPVLTIHVEQRWLYAPLAIFLSIFAWSIGLAQGRRLVPTIVCLAACASLLTMDILLSQYIPNIFFSSSATAARLAKRDIVDTHAAPIGAELVLRASQDVCGWALIKGRFFELYEGTARKLYCADTDDTFAALRREHPLAHAFTYNHGVSFSPANESK